MQQIVDRPTAKAEQHIIHQTYDRRYEVAG